MEVYLETIGRLLADYWETIGRLLGDYWETIGRLFGGDTIESYVATRNGCWQSRVITTKGTPPESDRKEAEKRLKRG